MINGADLTIYSLDGNEVTIELSAMQLQAVCKILGIKYAPGGNITCYSDKGLEQIMDKTINRWVET